MNIATSQTREQFPLSTRKIVKKTVTGTLGWFIVLLIIYIVGVLAVVGGGRDMGASVGLLTLAVFGLLFVVVLLTYLYQRWYFAVYFYDLTPDYIVIRKDPITPREITIPYERIQDVYVDQDIFDRLLGLFDVHLSSATISSGVEAHIDGVEKPAADGLRASLLKTVSERISKNKAPEAKPL